MRLFADERLAASGDRHIVAARHAAAFTALALRSAPELNGGQVDWLLKLDRDTENMHAARWLSDGDMTTEGLRLAVALAPFWSVRSYLSEGRRLNPLLARRDESVPLPLRMAGLLRSGELARAAKALLDEALETLNACCRLAEQLDDQRTLAEALIGSASSSGGGDIRAAADVTEAGLAIAQRLDDRQVIAFGLLNLGVTLVYAEELASGLAALDDSLAMRSLGNTRFVAISSRRCAAGRQTSPPITRGPQTCSARTGRGWRGRRPGLHSSNLRMVASLIAERQPEDAAQLIGASYTLRETLKAKADLLGERTNEATISTIRRQLSSARIDAAISSGYMLTIEQAQSTAMAALDRHPPCSLPTLTCQRFTDDRRRIQRTAASVGDIGRGSGFVRTNRASSSFAGELNVASCEVPSASVTVSTRQVRAHERGVVQMNRYWSVRPRLTTPMLNNDPALTSPTPGALLSTARGDAGNGVASLVAIDREQDRHRQQGRSGGRLRLVLHHAAEAIPVILHGVGRRGCCRCVARVVRRTSAGDDVADRSACRADGGLCRDTGGGVGRRAADGWDHVAERVDRAIGDARDAHYRGGGVATDGDIDLCCSTAGGGRAG
ncbi:MAG: hypothetical protein M9890_07935 [Thermomicrobiales bacterium]|nr:hypothetical protein [Thermomicrobiales bacterium]